PMMQMIIHAIEPVWRPSHAAFADHEVEPWMALQNAAPDQRHQPHHLFERMGHHVAEHEIVEAVAADLRHVLGSAFVEDDWNAPFLANRPEWLERGVVERPSTDRIG